MATLLPHRVEYCAVCGLPPEFCEYNTEVPHPPAGGAAPPPRQDAVVDVGDKLRQVSVSGEGQQPAQDAAVSAAAGESQPGDAAEPAEKKKSGKKTAKKEVLIERATRNKRKCVTTVTGLDLFGIKLADASKKFGKKFACGASVTKDASNREQIDVQGDFMDEMAEYIVKEFKEITMDDLKLIDRDKK